MAVTAEAIDEAMREVLPQMDAASVTLKLVMDALAGKLDVDAAELKAQWRPVIKSKVFDLIYLCPGNEQLGDKENVDGQQEGESEEEEEQQPKPRRSRAAAKKRRNAISDESDAQDESDDEPSASTGDAESEDSDEAPKKRRRVSDHKSPKGSSRKKSPPVKKPRASTPKQSDPPGLAALKELGRAAGVLNPKVYKDLKAAESVEEAEEVVRSRLQETGVRFSGQYPSSRDISAAKKKRARDKELEDIDTSLIITDSRPRRSAVQSVSYAPAPEVPDADGALVAEEVGAKPDEDEEAEFEEDAEDDDADEDASDSGSDESEGEF